MAKVSTNISLDEDLKKEAQALFAEFGLDLSTAITIFLKQSVREGRIPFSIHKFKPAAWADRRSIISGPRTVPSGDRFLPEKLCGRGAASVQRGENLLY